MREQYQIKSYDKDHALKQTVNPKIIKNRISFSSQINWWQGQFILSLDLPVDNTDFIQWDIIEINSLQEDWSLILIYSWFVDDIITKATNFESIDLKINWIFSFFSRFYYEESSDYSISKTDDPADIVDDIITFFNTKYNLLTWDTELLWTSVTYNTDNTDLFKFMNDLKDLSSNYYWFLGQNNILEFKEIPSSAKNIFTYKKDLFSITENLDWIWIRNRLILKYSWGQKVYNDASSQTTYWIREKFENKTEIWNVTSADEYAVKFFEENAQPKKKIKIQVNKNFTLKSFFTVWEMTKTVWEYTQTIWELFENLWIDSVNPWETCKIKNIEKDFWDNLLIAKKTYNQDKITLDLESYDQLIWLIRGANV